jgi:hypothetical protein
MAFSVLLSPSPPPLPLPSATATATAASYLIFSGHDRRRRRPLEHGCRCGRPPETPLGSSSGRRGSYGDEKAAPGPLGLDGSSTSSSDRRTGEARKLSYIVILKQFGCVVTGKEPRIRKFWSGVCIVLGEREGETCGCLRKQAPVECYD